MKELSVEEKARAYDKALQVLHKYDGANIMFSQSLKEEMFPELKESGDERIRKALIHLVNSNKELSFGIDNYDGIKWSDILAWLEKQGESSIYNTPSREVILSIWDLGNEWKELTGGSISTEHGTQLTYIQKHWQESEYYLEAKQGEQKLPIEKLPSEMKTIGESLGFTTQEECDKYGQMVTDLIMSEPTDKVEPKFHEGEWVTHSTANFAFKIINVGSNGYEVVNRENYKKTISFDNEDNYHLWAIQEAKAGDVLACNKEILLFKSYSVQGRISLYCWYNGQTNNFHDKEVNDTSVTTRNKIWPATQEQRDLLFQKIKESGYEWDAEKKELKKVEQKLADKAEPKFHEGDWVVYDGWTTQIKEVYEDGYSSIHQGFIPKKHEEEMRLWTVQDAKDGDVLAVEPIEGYSSSFVAICKKLNEEDFVSVCFVGFDGKFYEGEHGHTTKNIHPATKEQRDLLFQKIHEAGYEWDAEKKELRKIEYKHFRELDNSYTCVKFPFKAKVKSSDTIITIHGGQLSLDGKEWIKYQSDAEDGFKIYEPNDLELACEIEQKPAEWSKEDEEALEEVQINFEINKGKMTPALQECYERFFDKIKTLNPYLKKEWSEEDKEFINDLIGVFDGQQYQAHSDEEIVKWLKSIRLPYDKEWAENDEEMLKSIIATCELACEDRDSSPAKHLLEMQTNWLKSLRPQPKQEWSKEDEDILNTIINHFEIDLECTENDDIIRWLKSLRPQNRWKPSEEQMNTLLSEVTGWTKGCPKQVVLESLYNDLKKLREV